MDTIIEQQDIPDDEIEISVDDPETETNPLENLLRLSRLVNACDEFDDDKIAKVGRDVVRFAKLDNDSRADWIERSKVAMELALQVAEKKSTPWENASNVKFPLLTVAALQFHARAYPAVVMGNKVVKCQVTGKDQDGEKEQQAKRVEQHMNYQLLSENEDWESDIDRMLIALPIEGCEFKKTYFSKRLGINISEWIRPEDMIVNNRAKSLATCPRITHRIWFYPYEIDEKISSGLWRDAKLNITSDESDEETLQEFYEQHTFLDLDGDGYKEPWIITVHVRSQEVVRIVAGFYREDIVVSFQGKELTITKLADSIREVQPEQQIAIMQEAKFISVNRMECFTKYSFIPSPDGSFYDYGFGQLVGPLNDSVDTILNQMVDAGTLSNNTCGFIRDGIAVEGKRGPVSFKMGEFKRVQAPATNALADSIMQFKFNEPSVVLFQLLGSLVQATKEITGISEILAPQGINETATAAVSRVEQGMKFFTAIYKRIYRSLKQELKKLYKLNGRFLEPEAYFNVIDSGEQAVITLQDYRDDGTNVQPVADPQLATTVLAMAKAQALLPLAQDPALNGDEIKRRFIEAMEVPNPESLLIPKEQRTPPINPEMNLKAMQAADEHVINKAKVIETYSRVLLNIATAESKEAGTQLEIYKAELERMIKDFDNDKPGNPAMAAQQGNQAGVSDPAGNAGGMQNPGFAGG